MKTPNKDNSCWVDTITTFYPRLMYIEDVKDYNEDEDGVNRNLQAYYCVHQKALEDPCVACEGLSILSKTRR